MVRTQVSAEIHRLTILLRPLADGPALLTLTDAAKQLGLSKKTLAAWEKAGTIPPRRCYGGTTKLWSRAELAGWVVDPDTAIRA